MEDNIFKALNFYMGLYSWIWL